MSELGKGLYKVAPADLSTQDFIPDRIREGREAAPVGASLIRIDLQQYYCSQLDRWTVVHPGFASTATPDATLRPLWTLLMRYCLPDSDPHAFQRSNSARHLPKKDCWIHLPKGQNCIICLILLSFSLSLHPTIAPSAKKPSRTTSRSILFYSAHHPSRSQEENRGFGLWGRYLWTLQTGEQKSQQVRVG